MILGIAGPKRSGKSAVALHLVTRWGFTHISFADALKQDVLRLFPRTIEAIIGLSQYHAGREPRPRDLVYDTKPLGIRELLQEYGSEVRRGDDPDYWTNRWLAAISAARPTHVVASDVRFLNEYRTVRQIGGKIIRVERPGLDVPPDDHVSETESLRLPAYDVVVANDGSLVDLHARIDAYVAPLLAATPKR